MRDPTLPSEPDVAIVGGGIAGVAAANAAAATGAVTVLISDDLSHSRSPLPSVACIEASVWGCFANLTLAIASPSRTFTLPPRKVVVATGSHAVQDLVAASPDAPIASARVNGGPRGHESTVRQPASELARMAGAKERYRLDRGGWDLILDTERMSTVTGLFVAGDAAGPCSPQVAELEGRLAGLAAAASVGIDDHNEIMATQRSLLALDPTRLQSREAETASLAFAALEPGLVCRCEGVETVAVERAIKRGALSVNDVKRRTKAGMGECQGVMCTGTIGKLIQRLGALPTGAIAPMTARPPLRPITLGQLAGMEMSDTADASPGTATDR